MWWALLKGLLDRNNSPAWRKTSWLINKISTFGLGGTNNSTKSTFKGATTNDGMYGSWGGSSNTMED